MRAGTHLCFRRIVMAFLRAGESAGLIETTTIPAVRPVVDQSTAMSSRVTVTPAVAVLSKPRATKAKGGG